MKTAVVLAALAGLAVNALNPKKLIQRFPLPPALTAEHGGHAPLLTEYSFDQLIDHENPKLGTFKQRYWVDATFYKKKGPIVVFTPGEATALQYTGYLTNRTLTGYIAQNYSGATVLLEHRYWGTSQPYADLSEKHLKYLTVENSVQDLNYFAKHVTFPLASIKTGTKPNQVPWIFVGGSYSGVLAAYVNVHPDNQYWVSWSTSAPVQPVWNYWSYFEPIRTHMTRNCSTDVSRVIEYVDHVLEHGSHKEVKEVQALFGLENVTHKSDFADALPIPIWQWQDQQAYTGYSDFWAFCDALEYQNGTVAGPHGFGLEMALKGYGDFMKSYWPTYCGTDDAEACFGSYDKNMTLYTDISTTNDYRQWYWLICNEFGYWQTGAPRGHPTIVSRLDTVEYNTHYCNYMFPHAPKRGDIPPPKNKLDKVEYGGWRLHGDRVYIVNAGGDPWRDASTASDIGPYGTHPPSDKRQVEGFIKDGIHCWDLIVHNWIDQYIPPVIERGMSHVTKWLKEYKPHHA